MSSVQRIAWFSLIGFLTVLYGCQKGCGQKSASPETHERAEKVETQIIKDVHLNFSGLTDPQKDKLIVFLNEEICPCACPKTFAQCLAVENECKPGVILAEWMVDQIRNGTQESTLFKYVRDLNAGFLSEPFAINVSGAHRKGGQDKECIVIVEFADFECPACKIGAEEINKLIKENKDVVLYFMHFPLTSHKHALKAAIASEAAGKQGKFFEMHDLLFTENKALTDTVIYDLAQKLFTTKNTLERFRRDLSDETLLQKINAQKAYGQDQLEVTGTPSFLINGRPYNLATSPDTFRVRLAMERARKASICKTP